MVSRAACFSVTFTNLDPDKSYFPSVSHDAAGSYIALQPQSVKPRAGHFADDTVIKDEFASEVGKLITSSKSAEGDVNHSQAR
jgi:hypothetical protein